MDGCEQTADAQHCGSCTNDCSSVVPPNVTTPACVADKCAVGTCTANYFDQNATYLDGCECQGDGVPGDCATAQPIPPTPIPLGGTATVAGNLVPNGLNDWYVVTFAGNGDCAYRPRITLNDQSTTNLIRIDVSTDCSATYVACSEGGSSTGQTSWEFNYTADPCGAQLAIDPANKPSSPATVYVRVFATGPSTTCLPYSLSIAN
jgi:hypothetical protein